MSTDAADRLAGFLTSHQRVVVLTGAGCSTESGIPDYRDGNGEWKHPQPVTYQQFAGSVAVRQRYWARSFFGWRRIAAAIPNRAHLALARLERSGLVRSLITQNVDGLHSRAGSQDVIDLHGRLDSIVCLGCGSMSDRQAFQSRLADLNPSLAAATAEGIAPDGDARLGNVDYSTVDVPSCERCGGVLKPHVVFFGEGVPPERVADAFGKVDDADALLVVGSSLMVFSGFRFVQAAARAAKPVAALNLGRTRADDLLTLKIAAPCGETLAEAAKVLAAAAPRL